VIGMTTLGRRSHNDGTWAVAESKERFSEMIDYALADSPQTITRDGKNAVFVVSAKEWQRKTKRKGNLADFSQVRPCAALISRSIGPRMARANSSCEFSAGHQRAFEVGQAAAGPQRHFVVSRGRRRPRVHQCDFVRGDPPGGSRCCRRGADAERLVTWQAEDLPVRFEGRIINLGAQVPPSFRGQATSVVSAPPVSRLRHRKARLSARIDGHSLRDRLRLKCASPVRRRGVRRALSPAYCRLRARRSVRRECRSPKNVRSDLGCSDHYSALWKVPGRGVGARC
jgi:prevent-host-death family protein